MTTTFADLGVAPRFAAGLAARGIMEPFPVQIATIPDALAGRDVCGKAPTGSGKTVAFGIPLLTGLGRAEPRRPKALVLAPTRELAAQVTEELRLLAGKGRERITSVYGGVGYGGQRAALAKGVDVVVACPGRLEDLLDQNALSLAEVERVVIDEADRMCDMGFLPAVRRILDATLPDRQVLLFSATLGGVIDGLRARYQRNAAEHDVAGPDVELVVRHELKSVAREDRTASTAGLIRDFDSTIVFCRTRHGVDRLVRQLSRLGVAAEAIHGGRSQGQRQRALAAFSRGTSRALVATDVAARGIHVTGVACVVHHDPPGDAETYVHRSGRTGRAGAEGVVVSLVIDEAERRDAEKMVRVAKGEASLTVVPAMPSSPPKTSAKAPRRPQQQAQHPKAQRRRRADGAGRSSTPRRRAG